MTQNNRQSKSSPSLLRQALMVNNKPFPWVKAFCAGLAASLPIFIGLLLGNFQYGLLAGLGGFTYLYVFNIPYAQRAKKLFFVVLGISFVTALGTLAAPYPFATAILMGVIGAGAIFIFGALKIIGPSAIFFVLVFAMTTGMPVHPELALLRSGLAFLGGVLSWIIAMLGWFSNPHGPETDMVKREFFALASFVDSVGTEKYHGARQRVMSALKEAEDNLNAGYISWRTTDKFKRLYILNEHANSIFMYILGNFQGDRTMLPPEIGEALREIANRLNQKDRIDNDLKLILQPENISRPVAGLFSKVFEADAVLNEPVTKINKVIGISRTSIKTVFLGAIDKNSIVFISALRFGIVIIIAAIIAYQFGFQRSYWVPLSCVAVMSGATIVATYHRAIQRGIGTIIGILIASLVLATHPTGFIIALFVLLLTFITELFIVKNYGLAALFFTPNALLMAESVSKGNFTFSYFASARLLDVAIGSLIGLIGVLLIGRRSASSRLPHLLTKTIRSQGQFLFILFSDQGRGFNPEKSRERNKVRTNLTNLKTLYSTAAGEIPLNKDAVEYYWPIIFSLEQLGYLLEKSAHMENRPLLSDQSLAQLIFIFEKMANAVNRELSPPLSNIPEIEGFPAIQNEIKSLMLAMQLKEK
ncbi:FUSC family protein [Neobacillus terrae]|uniref:FUSC family protein n=1 Tax=Neobacillus terrae TaxID=3034837 RepID=UPI00140D95E2|nr:FUSC family protein [Neobacillus terrae]NHM32109.1 FUSC family protein [Neobacillus terrae]